MGKVFAIHELELQPDASSVEFEQLMQELLSLPQYLGTHTFICRGDRGERDGKYIMLAEIDSIATRNRYWPVHGQLSDEAQAFDAAQPELGPLMAKIGPLLVKGHLVTDYEVVAESKEDSHRS
jgi:hypothetical protein